MRLNKHYSELNESYLFSTIAHKVADYQAAHPEKDVIRLGIGDVTLPLAKPVIEALHKAVDEMGSQATFRGYGPEQGYDFLREAIRKYYACLLYTSGGDCGAGNVCRGIQFHHHRRHFPRGTACAGTHFDTVAHICLLRTH